MLFIIEPITLGETHKKEIIIRVCNFKLKKSELIELVLTKYNLFYCYFVYINC